METNSAGRLGTTAVRLALKHIGPVSALATTSRVGIQGTCTTPRATRRGIAVMAGLASDVAALRRDLSR